MNLNRQLQKLEEKATEVVTAHRRFPAVSLATLLYGGSLLYGIAIGTRNMLYARGGLSVGCVDRPVISIGNLTAGGTGKTPMTVHLAKLLTSLGFKVLIVSRGYKSQGEKAGAIVSDGERLLRGARDAGDEPFLMACLLGKVPVMVGKNRLETATAGIRRFSPDLILLDDAFQHQRLGRDLNLVLMDAEDPIGNGHLLPRGPLREPISALARADAVIFTRSRHTGSSPNPELSRIISRKPVFHSTHKTVQRFVLPALCKKAIHAIDSSHHNTTTSTATIAGRHLFAFSALANNDAFFSAIKRMGAQVAGTMHFPDHHFYDRKDIESVVRSAHEAGCRALVTTDKDYVRLPATISIPVDLIVMGVEIDFGKDEARWQRFVLDRIEEVLDINADDDNAKGA